jgi:Transposase and inactivated derivatives
MLYLAIDLHKDQLTINLRNEQGDVLEKRQVRTEHAECSEFFSNLVKRARKARGFMAIFEICGFCDWLIEKLKKCNCTEIVVIQPDSTAIQKTDRRDANALGELLWNNRKRLADGRRPNGIRRIFPADPADAQVRQLANLRQFLITQRTKLINKARGLLRKHNMEQDTPSKDYGTKKIRAWLEKVELPGVDRIEMNILLEDWKLKDTQILKIEGELVKHYEGDKRVYRLTSVPGISTMGAIVLLSRIGDITRFKTADSLANYFGLTPGCRNSGKATQRLGGITKAGSSIARRILNHAVIHVTRKCDDMKAWHKKIKTRRGAKTARVAVMRKLATVVWHILRWEKTYQFRYESPLAVKKLKPGVKPNGGFSRHGNKNQSPKKGTTPSKCVGKTKA